MHNVECTTTTHLLWNVPLASLACRLLSYARCYGNFKYFCLLQDTINTSITVTRCNIIIVCEIILMVCGIGYTHTAPRFLSGVDACV